ncbi:MAG: hypothetical protein CMJ68_19195 [Planctomycetaceae bacterium]|nr:hypothetical protein [Planctomycetaceae bacterium]
MGPWGSLLRLPVVDVRINTVSMIMDMIIRTSRLPAQVGNPGLRKKNVVTGRMTVTNVSFVSCFPLPKKRRRSPNSPWRLSSLRMRRLFAHPSLFRSH